MIDMKYNRKRFQAQSYEGFFLYTITSSLIPFLKCRSSITMLGDFMLCAEEDSTTTLEGWV